LESVKIKFNVIWLYNFQSFDENIL